MKEPLEQTTILQGLTTMLLIVVFSIGGATLLLPEGYCPYCPKLGLSEWYVIIDVLIDIIRWLRPKACWDGIAF